MAISGGLINGVPLGQEFHVLSSMALLRSNVVDSAMRTLMVVPADKVSYPLERGDAGLRAVRHVLASAEQRLDEGVVVADPRSAERGGDAQPAKC